MMYDYAPTVLNYKATCNICRQDKDFHSQKIHRAIRCPDCDNTGLVIREVYDGMGYKLLTHDYTREVSTFNRDITLKLSAERERCFDDKSKDIFSCECYPCAVRVSRMNSMMKASKIY